MDTSPAPELRRVSPDISLVRHLPEDLLVFLSEHFREMKSTGPAESCHVLDPDALIGPGIRLFSARLDSRLVATGALRELENGHAEVKSMRTAPGYRGQGLARVMLNALLEDARERGLRRLSLETGAMDFFAPARRLYSSVGFVRCPPFGHYVPDSNSVFFTLTL